MPIIHDYYRMRMSLIKFSHWLEVTLRVVNRFNRRFNVRLGRGCLQAAKGNSKYGQDLDLSF